MYLRLVRCFCIVICFVGNRGQRSWGPSGYNTGFSNSWTSNGFSNQNVGSWGSNEPKQSIYGNNPYNSPFDKNTIRRPVEEQPSYGNSNRKPSWSSNTGQSNTGGLVSDNGFNTRKPDKKKSESVINAPNGNTNSYSGSDNFSSWGQLSGSSNQNFNANEGNSNNGKNNNGERPQSNAAFSAVSNDNNFSFGSGRPSGNSEANNQNNNINNRPNSGVNNGVSYWGSNKPSGQNTNDFDNNKKQTGNDVDNSDYEENSVYSWNSNQGKNKPNESKWKTTTSRPSKATSRPASSGNWNQNGNGNTQEESNVQNNPKPTPDTSILDELDINDWYFGKESNYPKPPWKSVLNIDVSELWNFDKNRKPQNSKDRKNKGSNNGRRNRQTGEGMGEMPCECVHISLCDEEDMIVVQEDLKFGWGPLQAFRCDRLTEVCCTNPKPRFSGRANVEEESDGTLQCGQRRIQKKGFAEAFGGNVVEPGEFPWDLQLETAENNCSASLIHPQLALTAAHCVTNVQPSEVKLKAGTWSSSTEPPQHREVSRIIPHPAYSSQNPRNDIALLLVENGFELNDDVNTICLPYSNDKWDSERCLVAGWRPEEINGETVRVLEKSALDFIPQPECQNILLVTDLWRNYVLHESFLCAREKADNGECLRNEGGAVMCPSRNRPDTYLQIGIVSDGMNCDNFGRPGIITNVLKFLDWVNKNHFELGLNYDIDIRSQ